MLVARSGILAVYGLVSRTRWRSLDPDWDRGRVLHGAALRRLRVPLKPRLYHRLFDAACSVTGPLPGRYRAFYLAVPRLEPSFIEALYFSGITIATLELGDGTPTSGFYQLLAVSEALMGFGILTLAITYVLGIYGVLQQLGVLSTGLYHQPQDKSDPSSILTPHFPDGEYRGLETHTMQLHRGLVEI